MKRTVRERLAAGRAPDQVIGYFVGKYGEWILLAPPKRGYNLLRWLGPLAGMALGVVVLATAFRRWMAPARGTVAGADARAPPGAGGVEHAG